MSSSNGDALQRLRDVVHRLRAPGGCPWDREQTHASLVPHLLEEAYEAYDAILSDDLAWANGTAIELSGGQRL